MTAGPAAGPPGDLLERAAELVDIPSVSHEEQAIADHVERRMRSVEWLSVDRVANTVVARTSLGRERRVIVAGHIDTVPADGNERARIEDDTLWGLGAADMKGGITVMLELAERLADPAVDVSFVFYECEEVASRFSGLRLVLEADPELLKGDVAVLAEPTGAVVEAGCQGTMHVAVHLSGRRAHTARPWMGRNAIHRLGPLLARVAGYAERRPVLDGCEYREALQAVAIRGGVARNVVPDCVEVTLNHRFAPDRDADAALEHVHALLAPALDDDDRIEVLEAAPAAPPALDDPVLAGLVAASGAPARAKLGWTDVAFFAAHGVPAANFGPGDPTLAHRSDERVERRSLEAAYEALHAVLSGRR